MFKTTDIGHVGHLLTKDGVTSHTENIREIREMSWPPQVPQALWQRFINSHGDLSVNSQTQRVIGTIS